MQARIHVMLPYAFYLPLGERYATRLTTVSGYRIQVHTPRRSDNADRLDPAQDIRVGGVPGFKADLLRFDFFKESFERHDSQPIDPPPGIIRALSNDLLTRIRYVAKASHITLIPDDVNLEYHIEYLNDDGSSLPKQAGMRRQAGSRRFHVSFTALTPTVWDDAWSLPSIDKLPAWPFLIMAAVDLLPAVGPAIVVATTALEVAITQLLTALAIDAGIAPDLWDGLTRRGREPRLEDRFGWLSEHFLGRSLKENPQLWNSFDSLRKARNSFVHSGVAQVDGTAISTRRAHELVMAARKIIDYLRDIVPEGLRWPDFNDKTEVEFTRLFAPADDTGHAKGE